MSSYFAYGLRICSDIPLLGLFAAPDTGAPADVEICVGPIDRQPPVDYGEFGSYFVTPTIACMRWLGVAAMSISDGRRITIEPDSGMAPDILRLYLLGAGMGTILHQRGRFLLHGSAVDIGGNAIAFIGDCGAGKSTTAGALYRRGHALVSDDVVSIESRGAVLSVSHAYPVLRLCPDAAASLGRTGGVHPEATKLHPLENKHLCSAERDFGALSDLSLHRVYVLSDGEAIAIRPLNFQAAFMALLKNSYAARVLMRSGTAESHFHQAANLAGSGRVRLLQRPRRFDALDALMDAIEMDASASREEVHV